MVVTTMRRGQPMPSSTEIKAMLLNPSDWLDDYKIGQSFRPSDSA